MNAAWLSAETVPILAKDLIDMGILREKAIRKTRSIRKKLTCRLLAHFWGLEYIPGGMRQVICPS